jgi:hypothetical protein
MPLHLLSSLLNSKHPNQQEDHQSRTHHNLNLSIHMPSQQPPTYQRVRDVPLPHPQNLQMVIEGDQKTTLKSKHVMFLSLKDLIACHMELHMVHILLHHMLHQMVPLL